MEGKKISFGFSKTRRAPDTRLAALVQAIPEEERRDYIDCLEEKTIKIVGGEVIEEKKPLVIPMKPNTLVTAAERLQQIAAEVESSVDQSEAPEVAPEPLKVENETLEQQVERELMEEARNLKKVDPQVMTIQIEKLPPLEGQKEPTLDDYESVPIADFGLAMLRGMGWTPGKESKYSQPSLRPKGLGLGADKLMKQGAVKGGGGAEEEDLKLRKGCHVRVTAGKHSGAYGKVVSMDDESGRAVVELAMHRESVSVSEHTLQPVSKQHYDERSRVINSDKYDYYKNKEERNEKNLKNVPLSNAEKSSRRPESSKQDTINGREKNEGTSHNRTDLSSGDDKKLNYKESSRNKAKSQRRSSSEKDRKEENSKRSPQHSQRSASNGNDRYNRELQSRDSADRRRNNEPSRSRRSSSSGIDDRKVSKKIGHRSARNRSSSGDSTEQKSQNERKDRKSLTSSEHSGTRQKKQSSKQRDHSSGSESLNSMSSDEPRQSKKCKKKKSDGKKDIDKKRKGKKKRRDRDRSPNNRKHKR